MIFLLGVLIAAPRLTEFFSAALFPSFRAGASPIVSHNSAASARQSAVNNAGDSFPDISAEGVLVRDLIGEETLYQKNTTVQFPIASITKLMTSILFEEHVSLKEEYALSPEAKKVKPKVSALPPGAFLRGEDLIRLMMIESSNDIAYSAAEKIGKILNFEKRLDLDFATAIQTAVSEMNKKALALGLFATNFANPAGFDDGLHYSTAEDLFVLMKYAFSKTPFVWHASSEPEASIRYRAPGKASYSTITIKNTNPLLDRFPRIVGSKTGFTDEAGEAVVLLYQLTSGRNIAIILLKSLDRFGDAEKVIQWLDKGFVQNFKREAR